MRVTRPPTAVSNVNYVDCNCTLVKKNFGSCHFVFIIVNSGYTFKENYYCTYSYEAYFTLSDAIKECNANSQCKCIEDYKRADIVPTKRYHLSTSGTPYRDSLYDAWVITAI